MRTVKEIQEATLSPGMQTSAMGMVLNATSFNHIISNLYRNPLGAVIRELTTNALESHMLANTNKRVAIQLPTALEQEFVIRDFGTGLNHDEVEKYLNTLFSSSKDGDNNLMGGFGLGSKSPLALVDTFHIVAIKNGKKNTYAWIKEMGKLPSLIRLGDDDEWDEETTEDDGIKIVVPLGSSSKVDVRRLQAVTELEARQQLFAFTKDKIMFVDNIHVENYKDLNDVTHTILVEDCLLDLPNVAIFNRRAAAFNKANNKHVNEISEQYISIGGVAYTASYFLENELRPLKRLLKNSSDYVIALKAPIGVLDIPMSREEVLDTSGNQKIIKDLVQQAIKDVETHIKSLNINLDCDLVTYFSQFSNNTSNATKSNIAFSLDISNATFVKHETVLRDEFLKMRKADGYSDNFDYTSVSGDRLPERLVTTFLNSNYVSMYQYHDTTQSTRDKLKGSWWNSQCDLTRTGYAMLVTTSPLPAGVTHRLVEEYVKDKLQPTQPLFLIQATDTLLPAMQRLIEISIAWQKVHNPTEVCTNLGELDVDDILEFKKDLKAAAAAGKPRLTRSTYDYVPGLRIYDLSTTSIYHNYHQKPYVHDDETKIFKVLDIDGKSVSVGPDYLDANQQGKKVFLSTDMFLPLDVSAFKTTDGSCIVYASPYMQNILKDFVFVKVMDRSFNKALKTFEDAGMTVYTTDKPFVVERPKFEDADAAYAGPILLARLLTTLNSRLGFSSYSYKYTEDFSVKFLKESVGILNDGYIKTALNAALSNISTARQLADCNNWDNRMFKMYITDEPALNSAISSIVDEFKRLFVQDDENLVANNLYKLLVHGSLSETLHTEYMSNLTQVKEKLNEIQTQCNSTS